MIRFNSYSEEQGAFIVLGAERMWACAFLDQNWWSEAFAAAVRVLGSVP